MEISAEFNRPVKMARMKAKTWSIDDVCQWLLSEGFNTLVQKFKAEEIDGYFIPWFPHDIPFHLRETLVDLTKQDLREMGLSIVLFLLKISCSSLESIMRRCTFGAKLLQLQKKRRNLQK